VRFGREPQKCKEIEGIKKWYWRGVVEVVDEY
jgi:hypothetical protein